MTKNKIDRIAAIITTYDVRDPRAALEAIENVINGGVTQSEQSPKTGVSLGAFLNGHDLEDMTDTPAQDEPKQFYVNADANGFVEVRLTKDMDFLIRNYVGLGYFIRSHLVDQETNEPVSLPKFFQGLLDLSVKLDAIALAMVEAANDNTTPPEAA